MKKINLFSFVLLLLLPLFGNAQSIVLDDSYYNLYSLFIKDFQVDPAGNCKLVLLKQFSAEKLDFKSLVNKEVSKDLYNSLCFYQFDATQNVTEKSTMPYTPFGGNVSSKVGSISVDKPVFTDSLDAVIRKYPQYFKMKSQPLPAVIPVAEGFRTVEYAFDRSLGEYCVLPNPKTYSPGKEKVNPISMSADKVGIANPQTGTYTQVEGILKNKDYILMRQYYRFSTYTSNNEMVDSFSIMFNHPQDLEYKMPVYSKSDRSKIEGIVFIFGKAEGIGKKYSDPKKNNHNVVYIGNDGKLIFHTIACIGDDIMNSIKIYYAFCENNVISFFGDYWSLKTPGSYIFNLTADSVVSFKYLSETEASAKSVFVENEGNKTAVNKSSGSTGRYWSSIKDENFTAFSHQVLQNGDIMVWGRVFEQEANTTTSSSGVMNTTYENTYKDFVCLHLSPELDIIDQYVSKMPVSKWENRGSILSIYDSTSLKFIIILENKDMPVFYLPGMMSLLKNDIHLPYSGNSAYSVKCVNINLSGAKFEIKSIVTPNTFAIIYPGKFYALQNNTIYLAGYQLINKKSDLTIKKIQF